EHAPAGVLEPARRPAASPQLLPLLAAHPLDRPVGRLDDVEGIETDAGLRDAGGERVQVRRPHVERDGTQLAGLGLAELVNEALERGLAAVAAHPDDRA